MTIRGAMTYNRYRVRRNTTEPGFVFESRNDQVSQTLLIPGLDRLNPNKLFAQGQPGGWADPYDLTRMWIDDAGTTPATIASLGTGIGRVVTKGNAITLVQANAADRPVWGRHPVSGIRNLLSNTDTLSTQSVTVAAVQKTLSFRGTGTVTLSGASTAGQLVGTGANNIVSLTFTPSAGSLTLTVSGTVEIAQLESGATRTTYQRVTNRFDITEVGSPSLYYFSGNGVNHRWSSNATVDFSGTDKVTIWAGVRRLSNTTSVIAELGDGSQSNTFTLFANRNSQSPCFRSRGSSNSADADSATLFPQPSTNSLVGVGRVPDVSQIYVDGVLQGSSAVGQGGSNYSNLTLHLFSRGGSSFFYNGFLYSMIIAGGLYDSRTIARFADWTLKPRRLITA